MLMGVSFMAFIAAMSISLRVIPCGGVSDFFSFFDFFFFALVPVLGLLDPLLLLAACFNFFCVRYSLAARSCSMSSALSFSSDAFECSGNVVAWCS